MIERTNFWGFPEEGLLHYFPYVVTYAVLPLCTAVLLVRLYRHVRLWWKVGRAESRWDRPAIRAGRLVKYGILQAKVLRQAYPGVMHAMIAWGFFVFFLGTALATIDADFVQILRGGFYLGYKLVLDVFTAIALVGIGMAAYRRFVQKPDRLTLNSRFSLALGLVFGIVLTGLLTESLRLAIVSQQPDLQPGWPSGLGWWTPAGSAVASIWAASGLSVGAMNGLHLAAWICHAGLVALLLVTLPTSKLVHIVTTLANVFFSKVDRPVGRLAPALQSESGLAGAGTLRDFTWKQLMDGDACTECGRCQDACPAHASGRELSPKEVMLRIRDSLAADGPGLLAAGNGNGAQTPEFTGLAVSDAAVWSCTTCGACVGECPAMTEPVDALVDMRRYLLSRQRADAMLMGALGHLRRYGNSFGKSDRQRAMWTKGMSPAIKDIRKQAAETLWFVGDYASYSPALAEVTQTTARVLQQAGIDFGILFEAERNAGNDVRRTGEEGLFEMLAMKNRKALESCEYERIVTTDPHTYNSLRNEYDLNGKSRRVYHISEILDQAIAEGRLPIRTKLGRTVTYHDPCYLGRYNGVYEAPRRVLEAIGCRIVEMPRNRDRAYCCGAGGGRIWMQEEAVKEERPSENRIREAMRLGGVECFVVACPKDLTMYRDAVKTVSGAGAIEVKDLVELVAEAVREETPPQAAAAEPVGTTPGCPAESEAGK